MKRDNSCRGCNARLIISLTKIFENSSVSIDETLTNYISINFVNILDILDISIFFMF